MAERAKNTDNTNTQQAAVPSPPPQNKPADTGAKDLRVKWGQDTVDQGWTAIPNVLIEYQQKLEIDSLQVNLIIILLKHWWRANDPAPYPSKRLMADITGKSESTVQRSIQDLEQKGLVQRTKRRLPGGGGQTTNAYELEGLISRLKEIALEAKQMKSEQAEQKGRKRRGRN